MGVLYDRQVAFARLVPRLIEQAFTLGYEVTLGEAWRSPEQAKWNAEHGLGIANSLHTQRLAIDVLLFKNGAWLTRSEDYAPLGRWWEAQSTADYECAWGGRFHNPPDGNHFSIAFGGLK